MFYGWNLIKEVLKAGQFVYELQVIVLDASIAVDQSRIDIIDDDPSAVGVMLQDVKEHSTTSHKRFDIGNRLLLKDIMRQISL